MKSVDRETIAMAASNLVKHPSKYWSVLPSSADPDKVRTLRNAIQDYKYSDGSITEVENCLAWVLGFNVVSEVSNDN